MSQNATTAECYQFFFSETNQSIIIDHITWSSMKINKNVKIYTILPYFFASEYEIFMRKTVTGPETE